MSQPSHDIPASERESASPKAWYGSLSAVQYLISGAAAIAFGGVGALLGSKIGAWGDTRRSTVAGAGPQVERKLARPIMQAVMGGSFAILALYSALKSFARENNPPAAAPEQEKPEVQPVWAIPKHVANPDAPQIMAGEINREGTVSTAEIGVEGKKMAAR